MLGLLVLALALPSCRKASHSVTLIWEPTPSAAGVSVVGYNVYRRTKPEGPRTKIASRVPGPSYEDRDVVSGRTYFYVVTAVAQSGRESRLSEEARAKVP